MLILGIESSCDETAAAVVEDGRRVLSSVVASQDKLHLPYGGVVPEIASRAHLANMLPVLSGALQQAGIGADRLDAVAVIHTPGLVGALLVGLTTAKTVAWLFEKPLLAVNHLHAHAYAATLDHADEVFPCISLVASGGHTSLFHSRAPLEHELLATTRDDAAGEAFDKAASILHLGYPGGPHIDRVARNGNPRAVRFPRARFDPPSLDFSFSGVKTAVLYHCRGQDAHAPRQLTEKDVADVAASFQEAVVDALMDRLLEAVEHTGVRRVALGGGVAANSRLRARAQEAAARRGLRLFLPPIKYCIDNAAMVAGLGWHALRAGQLSDLTLDVHPTERRATIAPREPHRPNKVHSDG